MKFAIAAVVVLVAIVGVQSSIIAGIPGLGLGSPLLAQGSTVIGWGASIPAAINIADGSVVAAADIAAVPGATYVAKTRGAVHTAPLPGHTQSAASVNVAPAPGTW